MAKTLRCEGRPGESVWVCLNGDFDQPMAETLYRAFFRTMTGNSKLPEWLLSLEGMSGRKYRCLLNNLIAETPYAAYLETGSWIGSTACSAIYGNCAKITCIDNWSKFGGPRHKFLINTNRCLTDDVEFQLIEDDFRNVDYQGIGPFNVYFYDARHTVEQTCAGITLAQDALSDTYTLIIDDWNWSSVREGTFRALTELRLRPVAALEVRTTQNNSQPEIKDANSDWHNGTYLAVCAKA